MGLFDWRIKLERKAVNGAEIAVSLSESGMPVATPWLVNTLSRGAVIADSMVSAAMSYWSRNLAEPPLAVFDAPDGSPVRHELAELFAAPNPHYSQDELWASVVHELAISDSGAYIVAPLNRAGLPIALWPKASTDVRLIPSRTEYIGRYERLDGGSWIPMPATEYAVVRYRFIHPVDKWGSWSPVARVRRELEQGVNMDRWLAHSLRNMGRTSSLIGVDGLTDNTVAERIRDYINFNLMGSSNAERASVLPGKVTIGKLGPSLSELDFGALRDRVEIAVARGFGLAPELLHILATSTAGQGLGGQRQRELDREAYHSTLLPISKMLAAKTAAVLAPRYGINPALIGFDYSGVQAMQVDRTEAAARLQAARGYVSLGEGRAWLGLPPKPEEGDYIPEERQREMLVSRLAAPSGAGDPAGKSLGCACGRNHEVKSLARGELEVKAMDAIALRHESVMEEAARAIFRRQRSAVTAELTEAKSEATQADYDRLAEAVTRHLKTNWAGDFSPLVASAMMDGASVHEAGLGMSLDMGSERVAKAIMSRCDKITGANGTTIDKIRDVMASGRSDGWTIAQLAEAVSGVFSEAEGYRASMIARTESIGAANEGGYELAGQAFRDGMAVTKTWVAYGDDHTRESHMALDGETVDYEDTFANGLMYPGDGGGEAEEVINCRCGLIYEAK